MALSFVFSSSAEKAAGAAAIRDQAFDPLTGDLYLDESRDQVYTRDIEGIAADLKSNWLFFKGEWFLNIAKGVDYFGVVFKKGSTLGDCEKEFRREALAVDGVAGIELTVARDVRTLNVSGVVTLDTGQIFKASLGVTLPA